jgi:hypothetical protein
MQFDKLNEKIFKNDEHDLEVIFIYLNNLSIKNIPHDFINFETYEQIPGFRKKVTNAGDCAKFNSKSNKIEIFQEVINSKFINNSENFHEKSFHKILFESIKPNDFLKLTFIHEVAHFLQHEDFKQQKHLLNNPQNHAIHNFINQTLSYNNPEEYCKLFSEETQQDSKSRKDNNEHLHRIVTEGFADCFSYIVFYQTSHNKQESLNILNKHLNARIQARESTTEYYFTDSILNNVLSDLKENKNFNSLLEIKDYINKQIENYIPKFIEERLKKDDDISLIMNKRYLGYISKRLQVNTIDDLYKSLSSIGISNNVLFKDNLPRFDFNNKEFQLGIQIADQFIKSVNLPHFSQNILPDKSITIQNISSLRKQFSLSTPETPSAITHHKI